MKTPKIDPIQLIYVDLFAGGGGTTTAVHSARVDGKQAAIVAACINHDDNAIRSHRSNHKNTLHFTEDITLLYTTSRMQKLVAHVRKVQSMYPEAQLVLWASLECTNFSKAKGGKPREADSRTLAWHLFPYIEFLQPDRIQIENVEEFMAWGPLDDTGRPVSKTCGVDYGKWLRAVQAKGYEYEYRILNSADFGAYTMRKRYFGQFARKGMPIYWPSQTHAEKPENEIFGRKLQPWKAVREVLDLNDVGASIFNRKKPLVDATLDRIYAGLIKFVAGGRKEFLIKYNSKNQSGHYTAPGVDSPCPTITTQNRIGACFISKAFSGDPASKNISTHGPSGSITTKDHHQLITYYSNGNACSIENPSPTITTRDRVALVSSEFIDNQFGNGKPSSAERPAGSLTGVPKLNLVQPVWIMDRQYNNVGISIDRPMYTVLASIQKRPAYLMHLEDGHTAAIQSPSAAMQRIIEFCELYSIGDIRMRMLGVQELKRIMGFPTDYILTGSQELQKKMIGNAVEVTVARALVEATANAASDKKMIG